MQEWHLELEDNIKVQSIWKDYLSASTVTSRSLIRRFDQRAIGAPISGSRRYMGHLQYR